MTAGLLGKCRAALLDLLFPPKCAFCGRLLEEPGDVCGDCEKGLPFREEGKAVAVIGEQEFPCAIALYYEDMVPEGVRALKFGGKSWRAGVFARYIAQTAAEQLGGEFDAVSGKSGASRRSQPSGSSGIPAPSPLWTILRPGKETWRTHTRRFVRTGCGGAGSCSSTTYAPPAARSQQLPGRWRRRARPELSAPFWREAAGKQEKKRRQRKILVKIKEESPVRCLQNLDGLSIMIL